jgi:Ni/Co efflux regulator RcnB
MLATQAGSVTDTNGRSVDHRHHSHIVTGITEISKRSPETTRHRNPHESTHGARYCPQYRRRLYAVPDWVSRQRNDRCTKMATNVDIVIKRIFGSFRQRNKRRQ